PTLESTSGPRLLPGLMGAPTAGPAAGWARRPKSFCACSCSSTSATGSYEVVEREVRANLVYRSFTRVGGGKVPDDTVMNKWALALGPEVIENLHKRVATIAQEKKVV